MRNACGVRVECGVRKFACGATFGVAGAKAPAPSSCRRFLLSFSEKENGGGTTKKALAFYIRKTES